MVSNHRPPACRSNWRLRVLAESHIYQGVSATHLGPRGVVLAGSWLAAGKFLGTFIALGFRERQLAPQSPILQVVVTRRRASPSIPLVSDRGYAVVKNAHFLEDSVNAFSADRELRSFSESEWTWAREVDGDFSDDPAGCR